MKYLAFLLSIGLILSLTSCQKDILGDENVEQVITTEPTVTVTITTGVSGIITDDRGNPLPNVDITYSREQYTTDDNGYFIISDIKSGIEGGILYISENGYFDNYKFFLPEVDRISFMRVRMIPKVSPLSFSGETGGTINISGGGSVTFEPNSIRVESTGVEYTGTVSVYTHWYNPEDPYVSQSMPGDLRALSADGQIVQLSTYGMMAVELISENNQKLNLKNNTTATLRFPLPQDTRSHAPEIIETWSLNEETVYWEEENIAELDGDFYVTEVSHFSFWNCDVPYPLVNISGKLVNQDGLALSYYGICINALDRGQTGYGWSDSQGGFRGKVPKNEPLEFVIKDECGNVIFRQNLGPFNNDVTLGEIIIDTPNQVVVTGQLMCNGVPITQGYARICLSGGQCYISRVDDQGIFEQSIISCTDNNEITVQGFDTGNFRSSEVFVFDSNNSDLIEVGVLEACDELEEYIRFKIDGSNEALILNPEASINNGDLTIDGRIDSLETLFNAIISNASVTGPNVVSSIESYLYDPATQTFYDAQCKENNCNDFMFDITTLGTMEGEQVIGTFMGEIDGIVIMGSFKINIDGISELLECTVEVISSGDCNNDSLIEININGGTPPYEISIDGSSVTVINDNTYTITGLLGGDVGEYFITDANDLVCEGRYSIPSNNGLECEADSTNAICGEDNGSVTVFVDGGSGNYSYLWSNGSTTQEQINLSAGSYSVTVTDSSGCTTTCNVIINSVDGLDITIFPQDSLICDPFTEISANISGGNQPYTYTWINGETGQNIPYNGDGTYSVTVTDANGCTGISNVNYITNEIIVDVSSTLTGCDVDALPFGTLNAEFVFGGEPPYEYFWTNANTTVFSESIEVSFQENVILQVTDANGCIFFEDYTFNPDNYRIISGRVWDDLGNSLNIYDNGDNFLGGIEVRLFDANNTNDPIAIVITNPNNGAYVFENVEEGSYIIQVVLPSTDYNFVESNVGQNDNIDSEFNADGFSETIVFDGCIGIEFYSAGIRQ